MGQEQSSLNQKRNNQVSKSSIVSLFYDWHWQYDSSLTKYHENTPSFLAYLDDIIATLTTNAKKHELIKHANKENTPYHISRVIEKRYVHHSVEMCIKRDVDALLLRLILISMALGEYLDYEQIPTYSAITRGAGTRRGQGVGGEQELAKVAQMYAENILRNVIVLPSFVSLALDLLHYGQTFPGAVTLLCKQMNQTIERTLRNNAWESQTMKCSFTQVDKFSVLLIQAYRIHRGVTDSSVCALVIDTLGHLLIQCKSKREIAVSLRFIVDVLYIQQRYPEYLTLLHTLVSFLLTKQRIDLISVMSEGQSRLLSDCVFHWLQQYALSPSSAMTMNSDVQVLFQQVCDLLTHCLTAGEEKFVRVFTRHANPQEHNSRVDEICSIFIQALKVYRDTSDNTRYMSCFLLFCCFAQDRHLNRDCLSLIEKMLRIQKNYNQTDVFLRSLLQKPNLLAHCFPRILMECCKNQMQDSSIAVIVTRCLLNANEKTIFFDIPGIGDHILRVFTSTSMTLRPAIHEKQVPVRCLAMVCRQKAFKFTVGFFRSDAKACEELVKVLNEYCPYPEMVSSIVSVLLSLSQATHYRILISQVKDVLDICLKVMGCYVKSNKAIAADVLALLWMLLEEASFHCALIGGAITSFQMPVDQLVALSQPSSLSQSQSQCAILLNRVNALVSGAAMEIKLSCFLLYAALLPFPTHECLEVMRLIEIDYQLEERYIPNFATTSNPEFFPLILTRLLHSAHNSVHEDEDMIQKILSAIWFRCRYKCLAEVFASLDAHGPSSSRNFFALLFTLLGTYDTNSRIVQSIASILFGMCTYCEENRKIIGASVDGSAIKLFNVLKQYKSNENTAFLLIAAIGKLSLLETNAMKFSQISRFFEYYVKLLSVFAKSPKAVILIIAWEALTMHEVIVELIMISDSLFVSLAQCLFDLLKLPSGPSHDVNWMKSWCMIVQRLCLHADCCKTLLMNFESTTIWDSLRRKLEYHVEHEDLSARLCQVFIALTTSSFRADESDIQVTCHLYVELWRKQLRIRDNAIVIQPLCKSLQCLTEQPEWLKHLIAEGDNVLMCLNECLQQYSQHSEIIATCSTVQAMLTQSSKVL